MTTQGFSLWPGRPQANLPGTIDEHPNWRGKTSVPHEELAAEQGLLALLRLFARTPHESSTIQTGSRLS